MGTRLYVGNLSFNATEDDLRVLLSEGGRTVKEIQFPTDRETGRPRGFAFADMGNEADAEAAMKALDGHQIDGRALKVNEAQPRPILGGAGGGVRGKRRDW